MAKEETNERKAAGAVKEFPTHQESGIFLEELYTGEQLKLTILGPQ
ncbi:hypothetical protein PRBEI_2000048000 [Prionailurus iriomotensis]